MVNQGNFLKPAVGSVIVVEDMEDMNLPRCEFYAVCSLAGTNLKCSYKKNGLDDCFKPTLEYKNKIMKHCAKCGGCGQSDD